MAASAGPAKAKGRKRVSIKDRLERLLHLDSDSEEIQSFFREIEEAKEMVLESLTFRRYAPRTQQRQDSILNTYYKWVKVMQRGQMDDDTTPEELDLVAFPSDKEKDGSFQALTTQLQMFMVWVVPQSTPRSMSDEVVGYSMMLHYRSALMLWTVRKFQKRSEAPPPSRVLFNALTQAMRIIAHKMQMKLKRTPKSKSYLGLPEIIQLIDLDTRGTANIALAEGHHLAWLLGRCCALRPGAIGTTPIDVRDKQIPFPFLRFGNFSVTRGPPGHFDVVLEIRNLKITSERVAEETGYHTKAVKFYIKSPQNQHNLMLSIPHRFLVLALRRGALEDYTTVNDLLAGDKREIRIKKEFLDRPVVVAGSPRGLDVLMDQPASAHALSNYLSLHGQRGGYSEPISFYSIRRRAGTDFANPIGPESARQLMCHEPDARTLEKFFLEKMTILDVSSLAFGEGHRARVDEMQLDSSRLALSKLPPAKVAEMYGKELNALFRQSLIVDEHYRSCTRLEGRKNRERVLRRCALSEFIAESRSQQESTMTMGDYEQRKDELLRRAKNFNKRLLDRIKAAASTPEASQSSQGSLFLDQTDTLGDDNFEERAGEDAHEEDVDDQLNGDANVVEAVEEQLNSDEMADYVSLLDAGAYKDAVDALMKLLMANGLGEYSEQLPSQCPLCLDDDTMRAEDGKLKTWSTKHLSTHMKRDLHSKSQMMVREARNLMNDVGQTMMQCRFCAEIAPLESDEIPSFPEGKLLTQHVKRSNEKHIANAKWTTKDLAQLHEELKGAYGVYEEDFWGNKAFRQQENQYRESLRRDQRAAASPSVAFSKEKALVAPVPMPGMPGIMMGSFTSYVDDAVARGDIVVRPISSLSKLEDMGPPPPGITMGPIPTFEMLQQRGGIRPEDANVIRAVPIPGTEGGLIGQGNRIRDQADELYHEPQRQKRSRR